MSKKFTLTVLHNTIGKRLGIIFPKRLKSSTNDLDERKPNQDGNNSNLPSIPQKEDSVKNIDLTPFQKKIPSLVSSFFNKTVNDMVRDLLLIEPFKYSDVAGSNKEPYYTSAEFSDSGMKNKGFSSVTAGIVTEPLKNSLTPTFIIPINAIRKYSSDYGSGVEVIHCHEVIKKPANKSSVAFSERGMFINMCVKGFQKDDIYVQLEGSVLKINAQRSEIMPENEGGGKRFQQIYRRYHVPPNLDVKNITAELVGENLKIHLPVVSANKYEEWGKIRGPRDLKD